MSSPEKCQLYGDLCEKNGCLLRRQVEQQAERGGYQLPSSKSEGGGCYWEKAAWESFCKQVELKAAQGCGEIAALRNDSERLTKEKEEKGQFFTKT